MSIKAPWLAAYENVPATLDYPDLSMIDLIEKNAVEYPDHIAIEFMGKEITYHQYLEEVHRCAKSLSALGIKEGDRVTICMPNAPQAVIMFYGLNMAGAIPNMVHPLSAEGEIEFYLKHSDSVGILVLDAFYPKVKRIRKNVPNLKHVIVASMATELSGITKLGFKVTKGRKIPKIPNSADVVQYTDFMELGKEITKSYRVHRKGQDEAVILYSGGTTGTTKGILLSNLNFNALAFQSFAAGDCLNRGEKMLAIMPLFHGFGLGLSIHTMLVYGCVCILIPQFNLETYAKLLKKVQPNFIAGVPTLYEALLKHKKMKNVDLSCLKAVFSGGDSLSIELKRKVDQFLKEHNADVQVREGYGLTESVTASCLTPKTRYKEGSIGIPYPDMFYKIVKPGTKVEVSYGDEGEICVTGPTVMKKYLKNKEETEATLQPHSDGHTWLHTGDLGVMDEEGFIYFKQRLKRMIISSGYSVYPSQLENIIDANEHVLMSTVIGVPDPYKIQKVKAFVVLKRGIKPTDAVKKSIEEHCAKNIAKYAMPYEFEYRDSLPQTLVGKVAYTVLEKEELEKLAN